MLSLATVLGFSIRDTGVTIEHTPLKVDFNSLAPSVLCWALRAADSRYSMNAVNKPDTNQPKKVVWE